MNSIITSIIIVYDQLKITIICFFRRAITHNIGVIFLKLGKYEDACSNFEYIMHEKPTFKAGMHALVCYYMSGNKEKSKTLFKQILEISLDIDFEDKYAAHTVRNTNILLLFKIFK